MVTLLIEASNIRAGGGLTHLVELLRHASPSTYGFERVVLYAPDTTLNKVEDREWLEKKSEPGLNKGYIYRSIWKFFSLKKKIKSYERRVVFIPGTGHISGISYVTMCRNLLPLDIKELNRYFFSSTWLRLRLLRIWHFKAYKNAAGVIFLNTFCQNMVKSQMNKPLNSTAIVPHGLSDTFRKHTFTKRDAEAIEQSLKLIYVSSVEAYKHQWNVAKAVQELRAEGIEVSVTFIGSASKKWLQKLSPYLGDGVEYEGVIPYHELPEFYSQSDAFIFASTCETFGMVLLEAMASGLPVLCSHYSVMPEMMGDNVSYFDPLDVQNIKRAILLFYNNKEKKEEAIGKGKQFSDQFSWERTTQETFSYLQKFIN